MASGFLITCVRSKKRQQGETKIRFLRHRWSARNFVESHLDPNDEHPLLTVQVFDSNGYLEKTVAGAEALKELSSF